MYLLIYTFFLLEILLHTFCLQSPWSSCDSWFKFVLMVIEIINFNHLMGSNFKFIRIRGHNYSFIWQINVPCVLTYDTFLWVVDVELCKSGFLGPIWNSCPWTYPTTSFDWTSSKDETSFVFFMGSMQGASSRNFRESLYFWCPLINILLVDRMSWVLYKFIYLFSCRHVLSFIELLT